MEENNIESIKSKIQGYSKSPFLISYDNVIQFETEEDQNYFFEDKNNTLLKEVFSFDNYQIIKNTGNILVTGNYYDLIHTSYLRFKNKNKYFYAFVIGINYINYNTVELIYEVDVYNTFQFSFRNKISGFIEQQHRKNNFRTLEPQNYNVGEKITLGGFDIKRAIKFLVFVTLPSFKLSGDVEGGTYSAGYKGFKYYIIPYDDEGTLPFKLTKVSKLYPRITLDNLITTMSNTFDNSTNTVNQVVNIYSTYYTGLDYDIDKDGTIIFKDSDALSITMINTYSTEGNAIKESDTGSTGSTSDTGDFSNISYGNYTIKGTDIKKIVDLGLKYHIAPAFIIAQLYLETKWGALGSGSQDNNWGGIKYPNRLSLNGQYKSRGSISTEGDNYQRYTDVKYFFEDLFYLLHDENGMYKVEGKKNISDFASGLLRPLALYNYATDPNYRQKLIDNYNALNNALINNSTWIKIKSYTDKI